MKDEESQKSIKNVLLKSTVQKAPADMSQRVLEAWKASETVQAPSPPIIPVWIWWGFYSGIAALTIWAFANRNPSTSQKPGGYFSLPKVDLEAFLPDPNPVILMSLAAICLVILINVALLKKNQMS